jgi:hypothetical protein
MKQENMDNTEQKFSVIIFFNANLKIAHLINEANKTN